ncbi:siroheme synthase [Salinarchaeum sp. Harcht-Bsk1]|uniref:precorrin-2 dehydrogenase/sirohydrochlorin ferrochelatase family protein n=1 Tax=Salinarchaeum sp. Harcht-Bsk1 TaxID=1333523 RepID=UPI0003424865|nr:bifunctional precorrin-2 dehydrogenase/sirohydrochlorin ferrochelatase [Salinarchaeum sp. Harcht-Bsk1]AGN01888.1 siroheme synthase [Salinarchaeum sp. Harcht-Bsk1]
MIPLAHDFTNETVLIFGGGSVGARKARHFAVEADVVVVSPAFVDADFGDSDRIKAVPAPDDLGEWVARFDPALVVAATDDESVNDAAASAARTHGALVNRADRSAVDHAIDASDDATDASDGAADDSAADRETDASDGDRTLDDVAVPATLRDEPVTVSISTGGTSPALARVLRQRVESEVDGAGAMAELTGDLRERLRAEGVDPDARRDAVRAVVRSPRVWTALRSGDSKLEEITGELLAEVLDDP